MTLLAPILISGFYAGIIWVSTNDNVGSSEKTIVIEDQSGLFKDAFTEVENLHFDFRENYSRDSLIQGTADGYIKVPADYSLEQDLNLHYESLSSLSSKEKSNVQNAFRTEARRQKLIKYGISQSAIDSLSTDISIQELKIDETGEAKSSSIVINTIIGMALSVIIYLFIFLYGVQVMRGVIEEKTNRIVELMISSIKPFELMMGKILGIAGVGLTQIAIWVLLSAGLTLGISSFFGVELTGSEAAAAQGVEMEQAGQFTQAITAFMDLPLLQIFMLFMFFFIGGYLLYGAVFAAIGSAVDSETDTQQFMMPVTLPLVFSFIVSFSVVINDPNGALATWLSIVPLSSPIVMMARIPFDPPAWQIAVSMLVLIATILGVTWLAGRIYRTGILMYGKKASYKELIKWLFYKN
jgi:ABC-2 type transport system permease protein